MPDHNPNAAPSSPGQSSQLDSQQMRLHQLLQQQNQLRLELQHTQQVASILSTFANNGRMGNTAAIHAGTSTIGSIVNLNNQDSMSFSDEISVIESANGGSRANATMGTTRISPQNALIVSPHRTMMFLPSPSGYGSSPNTHQQYSMPVQPPATRYRSKPVCRLVCRYCSNPVCNRGMKAILLADSGVELFSTDSPPPTVGFVHEDYVTEKCLCRIRDVACLACGNQVGYHVTQPCKTCLNSCNNGHFWMFHKEHVKFSERKNIAGSKSVFWAELPGADKDVELIDRRSDAMTR